MKNSREYKQELNGLAGVLATVRTLEKIAASQIHTAKESMQLLKEYTTKISGIIDALGRDSVAQASLLAGNPSGAHVLVIVTGNKRLVGGLWRDVMAQAAERMHEYQHIMVIGKKAEQYMREEYPNSTVTAIPVDDTNADDSRYTIAMHLVNEFKRQRFARIDVAYPQFIALSVHQATIVPLLPFRFADAPVGTIETIGVPIIEPDRELIAGALVEKYSIAYAQQMLMETSLSELAARTITLEHATEKTKQILKKVRHDHAKERIRVTTQKQLESFTAHAYTQRT